MGDQAEFLTIINYEEYTKVLIHNPWNKGRLLQTVIISDKEDYSCQRGGYTTLSPRRRALLFTTTHSNLLEELGCIEAIAGICETEYVANPRLRQAIAKGAIKDMGSAMTPDRERIVSLNPDILLLSPYENASTYGPLEALGIPIIQCADYMETSALGSAEWIRFYGLLFGCEAQADSIFASVEKNYNELKELALKQPVKPKMMCELKSGSAWYVPGGRSTTGKLYHDAGSLYPFANYPNSGAVPLSFETVFEKTEDADIWLIKYNQKTDKTLTGIEEDYAPYSQFKAFKQKQVYGCNTAYKTYYEDYPFHPDKVLKDLIKIFHPSLLPEYELKYFSKLAE